MKITLVKERKQKPDFTKLGFGKYFTDHMLVWEYDESKGGWQEMEIIPYDDFKIDPACCSLHYGQGIFEGLKAYKDEKGNITMFRPQANFKRMNKSAERLCMVNFDEEEALKGLTELVKLEAEWIPTEPGTALYIRPFMFGSEAFLGVHPSKKYIFTIILSPVGSYYAHGLEPTKLIVEDYFTRASQGGTGEAKCMGNYACSLLAGEEAKKKGFDQVLWLDGEEKKYVTEVGSMNMAFVIDGKVVTPELDGSILRGITRDSALTVLRDAGYPVEERKISIAEVVEAYKAGKLDEAFGTGTAAVISPVGTINFKGEDMVINNGKMGKITEWLYDRITGIQKCRYEDKFGWVYPVK
ncbi:MAG: branched-chain amino acid aminotransferase [Clostridia bacterium]|nr:branched-chain amino acid aminotransferase [Clostridia bacterium]